MATPGASHYYYYENKKINLGPVKTDMLVIGFQGSLNRDGKEEILKEYDFLERILDETTSGSADITVVSCKGDFTPGTMELKLNLLEQNPKILYAAPFFPPNMNTSGRLAITNQFIVHLDKEEDKQIMMQLMRRTNTRIVEEIGPLIFILSADKNSAGNALDMANYFHESPGIKIAEPDFFQNVSLENI